MSDPTYSLNPEQVNANLSALPRLGTIENPVTCAETPATSTYTYGNVSFDAWVVGDPDAPYCRVTASPPECHDTLGIEGIIDELQALKDQDPLSWRNEGIQAAIDLIDSEYV